MGNETQPAEKAALPVITFNERASVHVNGEEIRAIHLPKGHTDGDSVIFFEQSNVIHMGDDFVTYGFPFIDAANGGSLSGLIVGIEQVLKMAKDDVKIIPGHGAVSGRGDLEKFLAMLKDTRSVVADAVKAGKNVEQIKKEGLPTRYEELGKGFIKTEAWIDVLYADVTQGSGAGK
jgi:glyoxylase-like metal-dependent hydrolase (beta-lactamase superfamily II)